MSPSPPGVDLGGADYLVHRPIAALDQDIGPAFQNSGQWRVFIEPGDQRHAFECGQDRCPVFQAIDRPIRAFALSLDRGIAIDRDQQAGAQLPGLGQIGDVAAVQNIETAIGEDQGPRQNRQARGQGFGRTKLGFEFRTHRDVGPGFFFAC